MKNSDQSPPFQNSPVSPSLRFVALLFLAFLSTLSATAQTSPEPLIDTPLRNPAITKAPDGRYFMSGTVATKTESGMLDFNNNDGVYLWVSDDLQDWQPLGKVWALDIVADRGNPVRWTQFHRMNPDDPDGPKVRGVQSPEVVFYDGEAYIAFAMSGGGTGLLKSSTGKGEGPYEMHARLTTAGQTPSLFVDLPAQNGSGASSAAGKPYWLWDGGWIAPLNEDLTQLTAAPRFLRPEIESRLGDFPLAVGTQGAFLFKYGGRYHLVATETIPRLGAATRDTFVASSDQLFGPYGPRRIMVPHGGEVTLFEGIEGGLFSTFGGDPSAVFEDRAGIVPLVDDGFLKHLHLARPYVTEGLPLTGAEPLILTHGTQPLPPAGSVNIRDPQILTAPDGFYYLTGTTSKQNLRAPGLRIWRSKDLENWEPMGDEHGVVWYVDEAEWTSEPFEVGAMPHPVHDFWAPQIHFIKGDYYIPFCMFGGGTGILKSTTGKPEGPYKDWTGRLHTWAGDPSLFEDDDGSVYLHLGFGPTQMVKLTDDLKAFDGEPFVIGPADGSLLGYEGGYFTKIEGKYVLFYTNTHGEEMPVKKAKPHVHQYGTYDFVYCWADALQGPYSKGRVAVPHGGHGAVFQDRAGQWMGTLFGNNRYAPVSNRLVIFPLNVEWTGEDLLIEPKNL